MPVLRSKSPRIDGGRCYPKLSTWGKIARGNLWEGAKRRTTGGHTRSCTCLEVTSAAPCGSSTCSSLLPDAALSDSVFSSPPPPPHTTSRTSPREEPTLKGGCHYLCSSSSRKVVLPVHSRDRQARADSSASSTRDFLTSHPVSVRAKIAGGAVPGKNLAPRPMLTKCHQSVGVNKPVYSADERYVQILKNVTQVCGDETCEYLGDFCAPGVDWSVGMEGVESYGTGHSAKDLIDSVSSAPVINRQRTFTINGCNPDEITEDSGMLSEVTGGVTSAMHGEITCETWPEIANGSKCAVQADITDRIEQGITNGMHIELMGNDNQEVTRMHPNISSSKRTHVVSGMTAEIISKDLRESDKITISQKKPVSASYLNMTNNHLKGITSNVTNNLHQNVVWRNGEINNCEVTPEITEGIRLNGVVGDVNEEDIMEMLREITLDTGQNEITPYSNLIGLTSTRSEITQAGKRDGHAKKASRSMGITPSLTSEITASDEVTTANCHVITTLPRKSNPKISLAGMCWSSPNHEEKKKKKPSLPKALKKDLPDDVAERPAIPTGGVLQKACGNRQGKMASKSLAQRGSGTTSVNNNNNNNSSRKGGVGPYMRRGSSRSPKGDSEQDDGGSPQAQNPLKGGGTDGQQQRNHGGKRGLKVGTKNDVIKTRTPNLNTPVSRTRSGSRSSGGSSPAGLHGRAPHKTAVVAPAPARFTPKSNSLNRFGFRNSAQAKSGDSTDSVNSILSDAQTASDSNSNIFELCDDENENKSTNRISDSVCDNSFVHSKRLDSVDSTKVTTPKIFNVNKQTPNSALSNRITAHTRQLPKPQVITVKPVSPKVPTPVCNSPNIQNSPLSTIPSGRTRSPSVKSLLHTPLKNASDPSPVIKQSLNATLRTPRESRDSESSTKSGTELDSGLGSSSESDRIRGVEGETDTLDSCNVESSEDASDAWLKKTRQQSGPKRRSRGSMEIQFNGTSSFEIKRQSLEGKDKTVGETRASPLAVRGTPSLLDKKLEGGKDKRDTTITYGMARQKFAPYSRGRYGYGYQSAQSRTGTTTPSSTSITKSPSVGGGNTSNGSTGSPGPSVTKIPGSSGLVRSRVAMIETPQLVKKTNIQQTPPVIMRRSNLKKPLVRPTSLEKTPILVMPVTEKTVELSKPVCRKLEYSENTVMTPKKNEAQRDDPMWENEVTQEGKDLILHQLSQPVEDILIVGSVEVETHKDSNVLLEADHHGSFYENGYDKGLSLDRNDIKFKGSANCGLSEHKTSLDPSEKEKSGKAVSVSVGKVETPPKVLGVYASLTTANCAQNAEAGSKHNVETPDDSGIKLLSPQSESSFEILESLSETVDLTTEEEGRKSTVDLITEEEDLESTTDIAAKGNNQGEVRPSSTDTKATDVTDDAMVLTSPEAKLESSVDSAFSSDVATVASVNGDMELRPPTKVAPSLIPKSAECILSSSGILKGDHSQELAATKGQSAESNQAPSSEAKKPVQSSSGVPLTRLSSFDLKSSMETSVESHKSASAVSILTDSGEHSNLSGKCTPTLNTGRSDLDQDFLIDDEIADQPGLMFGGSTMASSFFTDDGIFDDIGTSPPSHSQLKQVIAGSSRSRANSVDTTSSVGGDDLMLDYFDMEEAKTGGSSNRSSVSSCLSLPATLTGTRPKKMHLRITIPGRRYDEEVLSPDANEIFSEWTAMMAEVSGTVSERCVSREGSTTSSGGGGGGSGGRTSRPRLSSSSEVSSDSRRSTVLRPPRQGGLTEMEGTGGTSGSGGGVFVDRTAYHYMCQDVTSLKTMLLRLRRVLQVADTINPFDANLRNSLYLSLAGSDSTVSSPGVNGDKDSTAPSINELSQENMDLRRQVVLLQQQLQERDRTIRLLQQQLAQNLESQQQQQQQQMSSSSSESPAISEATCNPSSGMVNAATQTERSSRSTTLRGSSLSRTTSIDDGLGPTVSSEVDCMPRGRSTSASNHRQPRATSQPPGEIVQ